MEQVQQLNLIHNATWLQKRARAIVHRLLAKLTYGKVILVEGHQQFSFPTSATNADITAKIYVHDFSMYSDFIKGGSIGAAEAFIAGKWTSPNLTNVIRVFARAQQQTDSVEANKNWLFKLKNVLGHWRNRNSQSGSKRNILAHYDLGNELYTRFLDPKMTYSAAIYPTTNATLDQAQAYKLKVICDKLQLSTQDHLLEIGTGWGGLAIFAAKHYGCKVTTTTISDEQFDYAKQQIKVHGLTEQITILKKDYRELTGQFDKLVSIEMIEAVGFEFLPGFFEQCHQRLKAGGKMLIQSITIADERFDYYKNNVDFIQKYIFPGGFLPSVQLLNEKINDYQELLIDDVEDIGLHYAKTLAHWRENFLAAWSELTAFGFDEQFKRLWLYYFAYCEGAFLERSTSTVQLLVSKYKQA